MTDPAVDDGLAPIGEPHTVDVQPVETCGGLAWHWQRAIDAFRAECPACGSVPCWRHTAPIINLLRFDDAFGSPALGPQCWSGAAQDRCTGDGGVTVVGLRGMVASACQPCAEAHLSTREQG